MSKEPDSRSDPRKMPFTLPKSKVSLPPPPGGLSTILETLVLKDNENAFFILFCPGWDYYV